MCKFDNPGLIIFLEPCPQSDKEADADADADTDADADADADAADVDWWQTKVNLYVSPREGKTKIVWPLFTA